MRVHGYRTCLRAHSSVPIVSTCGDTCSRPVVLWSVDFDGGWTSDFEQKLPAKGVGSKATTRKSREKMRGEGVGCTRFHHRALHSVWFPVGVPTPTALCPIFPYVFVFLRGSRSAGKIGTQIE